VISALAGAEHQLHQAANFSWNHPGYVAWSPDAKFLAFSDRQENGGHTSIALLAIADATTRRLTTPPDQAYDYGPAFSPDGLQGAFITRNGAGSQAMSTWCLRLAESPEGSPSTMPRLTASPRGPRTVAKSFFLPFVEACPLCGAYPLPEVG